jgi:hypothetical protein
MKTRYTVYSYYHLARVVDTTMPNQPSCLDRAYTLGDAMVLASWLESRASGYVAPDALPIRGMAP